jgi:hypothetical protein
MATNTYVALDKVTVGTATSTITFTGINQGYTDLVLVYQGATAAAANMFVRVGNGSLDTGSNYSLTQIVGSGTSASSSRLSSQAEIKITEGLFVNTNEQCNIIMNFQNYSNTTTNKTLLSRANSAAIGVQAQVSLWRSTSAINTISVYASQNFNTGTTISLYGIAAEGMPYANGGYVTSDANYYYHTFKSTGTFTPLQSLTCDILEIAGGGAGTASGNYAGGGGGAGGVAYLTAQSVTATGYTITVGGGGATGSSGTNSQFAALTAAVGGGVGGVVTGGNGGSGGSGGGGGSSGSTNGTGGTATSGQGFAGGNGGGLTASHSTGGGGGGAGAIGSNGDSSQAGNGGAGTSAYSAWATATNTGVSNFYAGGGGGGSDNRTQGTGGSGGAGSGTGVAGVVATAATANTGSGGGGGAQPASGAAGGSGLVIVRYAK